MPPATTSTQVSGSPKITRLLAFLLVAHVGWGLARVPTKVWAKRLDEIEQFESEGPSGFFLDNEHRRGGPALQRLCDTNPQDRIVLWRGEWKGAMEFVPAVVAPRLVVHESAWPSDPARWRDYEPARITDSSGVERTAVIIGATDHVRVEVR